MKNIKNTLQTLIQYYMSSRGAGHTSAALGIKTDTKALYLSERFDPIIEATGKKSILFGNVEQSLLGRNDPLLIDHHVLVQIFQQSLAKIDKLENELKTRIKLLTSSHIDFSPTFEYKLNINGVTLELSKTDFAALLETLSTQIKSDYDKAIVMYDEYWQKRKTISDFHQWLDDILCERDHYEQDLPASLVNEIYRKLVDVMF